jgi:hypothetical protein
MFKVKLLIAAVMVSLIFVVGWRSYVAGQKEATNRVTLLWTQEKLELTKAINDELIKADAKNRKLTQAIATITQEYNREILNINSKHRSIVNSLQHRPSERASDTGVPTNSDTGVGCTGKGLARPDAEFLAGYATDASQLNEAFLICKSTLDKLKEAYNNKDN